MASIRARKKKDGSTSYTAVIRLTVSGKAHSETMTSPDRKFLEAWISKREGELKQPGAIEKESHKGTTVGDVLKWYKEDFQGATKFGRTKLAHLDYLTNYYNFSSLDAVNLAPSDLIQHARERAKTAKPSTINNDFIWLRNAMRAVRLSREMPLNIQAVDDATFLLRKERLISKSNQRDRRPLIDELNKLMEYFAERDQRAKLPMCDLVLFALFSSRRQDEICRITWSDLDERREGVLVRDMKHPTKKQDTFVFLPDRAWSVLQRQEKREKEDRIFPYVAKSVSAAFTRTCNFLEIKDLRYHDLRHECVSCLFELGNDIPRVASISGHKSWSSLQRYTHLRESGIYDKYENWEWLPTINESHS